MQDPPSYEVITVLNGCTDDTREVIDAFREARPEITIRIVESPKGRCIARNHGAFVAHAPVVAFLDADDAVYPEWLRALYDRTSSLHGIVSGSLVHTRVNRPEVMRVYGIDPNEPDPVERSDLPLHDSDAFRDAAEGNFAAWREDFLRVGGFDAAFQGGLEGTDYCLRSIQAGIRVNTCQMARIDYWLRDTPRGTLRQQRALARCKVLFFVRHYGRGSTTGVSFKYSLLGLVRELLRTPAAPFMSAEDRHALLMRLGGHLGSVEGHVRYRVFRRVPAPELLPETGYQGASLTDT